MIKPAILGLEALDQPALDQKLIDLDGNPRPQIRRNDKGIQLIEEGAPIKSGSHQTSPADD